MASAVAGLGVCLSGKAFAAPPTDILLSNNTAIEWCPPGTLVGLLSAVDADVGDTFTYQLIGGAGSDHNNGAYIVGNQLRLVYGFDRDFEVHGSLNFKCRVRATDSNTGEFVEKPFVLLMLDDREENVDGDGLTEAVEEDVWGTSDLIFDFDGDGVGDGAEASGGSSPTDPLSWPAMAIVGWGDSSRGVLNAPAGLGFLSVVTGEEHSMVLRSNGTVSAWGGLNVYGQTSVPAGLTGVVDICAGGEYWVEDTAYSVAVRNDGTVVSWGVGHDPRLVPPVGLNQVIQVAAGRSHCLALKSNGTVVEWGSYPHPGSEMPGGLSGITYVAAGGFHSLALRSDGRVVGWGSQFDGTSWSAAKVPAGLSDVVALSAGRHHSLALRADGKVVAWGHNSHGQTNVPANLTDVVAISAGGFHSMALKSDGTVVAWGLNSHGQSTVPASAAGGIKQISAGILHSLAVKQNANYPSITSVSRVFGEPGVAFSHGIVVSHATASGFSANGLPSGLVIDPVTGVISGTPTVPVRQSVRVMAETDQGLLSQQLWFGISTGVAPDGISISPGEVTENAEVGAVVGSLTATDPDAGDVHSFQLVDGAGATDNHRFVVVGNQLLLASDLNRDFEGGSTPFSVRVRATDASLNPFDAVLSVAFLDDTTEDFDGDGLTEAEELLLGTLDTKHDTDNDGFGDAFEVERGTNPGSSSSFPNGRMLVAWGDDADGRNMTQPGVSGFVDVAAGARHSLAISGNGQVIAWGFNGDGQSTVPVDVTSALMVDAGDFHSVALRSDGTVAAWGKNDAGQTNVPAGLAGVVAVAAGGYHNLALRGDGTVVSWGDNRYGQADVPPGLTDVVEIAAGGFHSLALRGDGTLVAWGSNWQGVSVVPAGLEGVTGISCGGFHSLAMLHDGRMVAWGANDFGQTIVPLNLGPVVAISGGWEHTLVLKADGTLAAWGKNDAGQCMVPLEAVSIRRICAGDLHNLALRQASGFPGIPPQPMLRSWPGEVFTATVPVQHAVPSGFAAMGLPAGVVIDPLTGTISGPAGSGWKRSVRVSAATNVGSFSGLVWMNATIGVAPTNVTLSNATIMENLPAGTVVGNLSATDSNVGDTHSYSLSYSAEGPDDYYFQIVGNQLRLLSTVAPDFEALPNLNIRVKATDSMGNEFSKSFVIQLLDDRLEDADGDGINEQNEEDILGTSDVVFTNFNTADPDMDGMSSLLEHAFNLNPKVAGRPVYLVAGAGSTAGLPAITFVSAGAGQMRLRLEYIRRVGSGLTYTPEFGPSPTQMLPAVNAVGVTAISSGWERCVVEDSQTFPGNDKRFGRVRVRW